MTDLRGGNRTAIAFGKLQYLALLSDGKVRSSPELSG